MAPLSFAQPLPQDDAPAIPGQLYVHFDDELNALGKTAYQALEGVASYYQITSVEKAFPSLDVIARSRELTPAMETLRRVYRVHYNVDKTPEHVALGVESLPGVLYAEPVYISESVGMPDESEPTLPDDEYFPYQSQLPHMRLPEAWDVVKGEASDVVIAVVDNGTDWHHPDLIDNVWTNADEVADDGIDNDGNGYIDDVHGWRFFDGNPDPTGPPENAGEGHGTAVAGVAAAVTNNGLGIAGSSWNAKFMPINVKCKKSELFCHTYDGILYAATNGADIINTSLGGSGYSRINHLVIKAAYEEGALVVASAGNDRADVDLEPHYPSSHSETLSVGGTRKNSDRNVWNYGLSVNVFAPSEGIDSTEPDGGYGRRRGTSFSTPLTAGVAALVKTAFPDYTPGQIREQIRLTAVPIDEANTRRRGKMGRGKVDAYRAVTEAPLPGVRVAEWSMRNQDGSSDVGVGDDVTLSVTFENFHGAASSVSVEMLTDESNLDFTVQRVDIGSMGLGDRRDAEFSFTIRDVVLHGVAQLIPEITAGSFVDRADILRIEIEPSNAVMRSDSLALVALYNATDGPNWYLQRGWLESPVRDWSDITVTGDRVTAIDLWGNDLAGVIPPEIGTLSELRILRLYKNDLLGPIPTWIGALTNLEVLSLSSNDFTGSIPSWIGDLIHLEELYLSYNNLSGPIPSEIGALNNLVVLWLHNNKLSGSIPPEIGGLKSLEHLTLTDNSVAGSIPSEIGMLTNLRILKMSRNKFSGSIPPEIGNLINLEEFSNTENELTGSIPAEIGNLDNLWYLNLSYNNLAGSIPQEIGNLDRITSLSLCCNNLEGSIPSTIGNLTNLEELSIVYNQLSGPIPPEIEKLINLEELRLYGNQLTGSIPLGIGKLNKLWDLGLSENELTGSIPSTIGNLTNLEELSLSKNQLTGPIPLGIGKLNKLKDLGLSNNELTGSIPSIIGNLTNLEELSIIYNQLSGSIPPEIEKLINLQTLRLYGNQLTGSIPSGIGKLNKLRNLGLDSNELTGSIPSTIGNLTNLEYLTLGNNQLSGSIPSEIEKLINLKTLILYVNELSGSIPSEIGSLFQLKNLGLSSNDLNGKVPVEIGNLVNLETLGLQNNQLIGTIPSAIMKLNGLKRLSFGGNQPLCAPLDDRLQAWLKTIEDVSGKNCAVGVFAEQENELPAEFALHSNYPNPFNPQTTIEYALPEARDVRLIVYDMLGRKVTTLLDGPQVAGTHSVHFDAEDLPSGLYVYRLEAGAETFTRKMTLVR